MKGVNVVKDKLPTEKNNMWQEAARFKEAVMKNGNKKEENVTITADA
jgi:hypothetical protein